MLSYKHQPTILLFRLLLVLLVTYHSSFIALAKTQIPPAVEQAFKNHFPSALEENWKKLNSEQYTVQFKLQNNTWYALFDITGKLIEKRQPISKTQLPNAVMLYIERQHEGAKFIKAFEVSNPNADSLHYDVQIKDGKEKVNLYLTKDGYLLGK